MPLTPGTRVGPYEILAPLGAGGMGEVYRARDSKLDRFVAIKVLPSQLAENTDRARAVRARSEGRRRAVASQHPLDFRLRPRGDDGVCRHGIARRRDAAAETRGTHSRPQGRRVRRADRPRPGRRARQGHRPPRSEAGERLRHRRRPREDSRLRPRAADAGVRRRGRDGVADDRTPDRSRHRARHSRLHVT